MNQHFKRIVLTGATGGIGSAIAKALDRLGYELLLTGRDKVKLEQLLSSLSGEHHEIIMADLTSREGINTLKNASDNFGINGVINCLGLNKLATLTGTEDEEMSNLVGTNLLVPMGVCKALLPLLEAQPKAIIVNVGSILGSIGFAGSSVYCATKFGLRGFTEALRRELSDTDVSVIYLAPRATDTALNTDAMNQMNRELGNTIDKPEKVAEQLIKVLALGKSTNRYLGWPEAFFVRLNSLLPRVVDKALSKQLPTIKRYCGLGQAKPIDV
ncbi:MAG: SDR family oxidoreductase [Gammaproteobacteria bacterium]|nr:SDR family oxidoreductase [Gammaproteobacteria bacterium]MBL4898900.1 SDR family oxidoreductase [Colwellia sp.]